MLQFVNSLLQVGLFGTPVVACFAFLIIVCTKEMRPALGAGLVFSLIFALIGAASFSDAYGRSGMGADWGAALATVAIAVYVCSGFLVGIGVTGFSKGKYRLIAAMCVLFGSIVPIALPLQRKVACFTAESQWNQEQERQRREPHALVDDGVTPGAEDTGYRIRYVDDKGVVRLRNGTSGDATSLVVLPPGKRRLLLKADTEKGEKLKLPWTINYSVEVTAGTSYQLHLKDGIVSLVAIQNRTEPNQALLPTTTAVTPRACARVAPAAVAADL